MAKRPVEEVVESDEEEEHASSRQAKRARHEHGATTNGSKKKKTARPVEESDDDAEEASEAGDERPSKKKDRSADEMQLIEEDNIFEVEMEPVIQQAIESRPIRHGGVAEMGIILSLEMHNFMCHKRLSFKFGDQVNFIIGHNGSGKSAVLTALTVALGGKATATSRGSNLKSFIKEGESISEVTVVIKNGGVDAYMPDKYGNTITITRRFSREGTSSYKIKGGLSDRIISTKREELTAICDHMNIQVDNPMNVLTQDTARQFLSAARPKDKYNFFLKGTQLSQLSMEYEMIRENLKRTKRVIDQKHEIIPELVRDYQEALERYAEAEKARDQREKLTELEKEKAWSIIVSKEKEVKKYRDKVVEAERVLPQLVSKYDEAEARFKAASQIIADNEELLQNEAASSQPLEDRRKAINTSVKEKKALLQEIINEQQQFNTSLKTLKKTIDDLAQQIVDETKKLEEDTREKREMLQARHDDAKHIVEDRKAAVADHFRRQEEFRERGNRLKGEAANAEKERDAARREIDDCRAGIDRLRKNHLNKLEAFGPNMRNLLDAVKRETWVGDVPLGPLGMFVDVKPSMGKWVGILQIVIGSMMGAFVLTNNADRPKLRALLEKFRNNNAQIIIAQKDIFDFAHAEPPPSVLTILRTLEIKDEFVTRVLINSNSIERTMLVNERSDARKLLDPLGRAGVVFSYDGYKYNRYSDGGNNSQPLNKLPQTDSRLGLFPGPNPEHRIATLEEQMRTAEAKHQTASQRINECKQEAAFCDREWQRMRRDGNALESDVRAAESDLAQAEMEMHQDEPASLEALAAGKAEAEQEKESLLSQFTAQQARRAALQEEVKPLTAEMDVLRAQIASFDERKEELTRGAEKAAGDRLQAQNDQAYYQKKLEDANEKIKAAQAVYNQQDRELRMWLEDVVQSYPERNEKPRKTDVIEREMAGINRALDDRQARDGASIEEMAGELARTDAALQNAKKDHDAMNKLHKSLDESLRVRMEKWHGFRRHIAVRAKIQFQYHLSKRGYFGKLTFNHADGHLDLKVQTEDSVGTQMKREKDPKSLSGGEKSFSTICLLLSLWEAISCPIRCLDEFDVFMDAVNRRISMQMMTQTAKQSAGTQYILITPQDMSTINLGPEVRVHRMNDPERGQGQLPF